MVDIVSSMIKTGEFPVPHMALVWLGRQPRNLPIRRNQAETIVEIPSNAIRFDFGLTQ